jgi:hypothetical protein
VGFRRRFFKVRLAVLAVGLAAVSGWALKVRLGERRRIDWSSPHVVVLCPLVSDRADGSAVAARLASAPDELERWFADQQEWWTGTRGTPVDVRVAESQRVGDEPPPLPDASESFVERWRRTRAFLKWFGACSCRVPAEARDASRVFVFVYPRDEAPAWEGRHSVGTTRGRRGMVFASDDPARWGNALAVIAHELLHSVGARDHRRSDGTIAHPSGYADPSKVPLLPQEKAEVMALGIPYTDTDEELVDSLDEVVMGLWTAKEIGWRD